MNNELIETIRINLLKAGATNVSGFIDKITANSNNSEVFHDLLFEARAALMFLMNNFSVEMRESPDLKIKFVDYNLFVEVKHFRFKEQDAVDQKNMRNSSHKIVRLGDTISLENDPAWEQIFKVAKKKVNQYVDGAPNILTIGSSSPNCIDDSIIQTAINLITEDILEHEQSELSKLNGIILISSEYNLSQKRNVYFFPISDARISLDNPILDALQTISRG